MDEVFNDTPKLLNYVDLMTLVMNRVSSPMLYNR